MGRDDLRVEEIPSPRAELDEFFLLGPLSGGTVSTFAEWTHPISLSA